MESILASFAQFDNDQRAERTAVGLRAAKEKGRVTHKAPIRYLKSPKSEAGPSIVPDPERAPWIKEAFELFSTGRYQQRQILKRLNSPGCQSRRGRKISPQTLKYVLANPIYCGWVFVRETEEKFPGD
jgi:site-specific DNA recombinase